jgi:hypothetical protein
MARKNQSLKLICSHARNIGSMINLTWSKEFEQLMKSEEARKPQESCAICTDNLAMLKKSLKSSKGGSKRIL